MNALEHSDRILRAPTGSVLIAVDAASGVDMGNGGRLYFKFGDKFRVKHNVGDLLWCYDEAARLVTFDREGMAALSRAEAHGEQQV